ncbi:MAG: DUF1854 domain-containing protein [Clostridia bacterium]
MSRLYIDGDEAKFTSSTFNLVNLELITGEKYENLEPRRLFPLSGLKKYISLLDEFGHEKAIIRNIDSLMPDSKNVIQKSLDEYYLIPKIIEILDRSEKYGVLKWTVKTDRGVRSFDIKNRNRDIKILFDDRILVRDADDNRYEIPNMKSLSKESLSILYMDI